MNRRSVSLIILSVIAITTTIISLGLAFFTFPFVSVEIKLGKDGTSTLTPEQKDAFRKELKTLFNADVGKKSQPKPSSMTNSDYSDQAYVLLLTNNNPMKMVWALEGSFRDVNTTRRRIVMVTPAVPEKTRDTLKKMGMEIREIGPPPKHSKFAVQTTRWADTLAKLSMFDEPSTLKKFVYIDADFIVNENMDYLFDKDTNGKVTGMMDGEDCHNNHFFLNAGLMVASPNATLKKELFAMLDDPKFQFKVKKGDQEMLDVYLKQQGMLRLLSEQESAFPWRCACIQNKEIDPYDFSKIKAIHFTGWWIDANDLIARGENAKSVRLECGRKWYMRWVAMYRSMDAWWKSKYPDESPNL